MGSGHEVEISYASPDQYRIDRLFGNEVGNASHYSYAITKNQDGQKSISYYNLAGQVIATALVGTPGENLTELTTNNYSFSGTSEKNLLEDVESDSWNSDGERILINNISIDLAGEHDFYYRFDAGTFSDCSGDKPCRFELEIYILNC